MERVRRVWARRVVAEYRSAALFSELLHWLITLGVSPDTLEVGVRIVADELAHAELSREVFLLAGGDEARIPIQQEDLSIRQPAELPVFFRALAAVVEICCCGETVAVPLFNAIQEGTTQPDAVRVLTRIQKDEAVHRAFGWTTLDELMELAEGPAREFLAPRLAESVRSIQAAYASDVHACTDEQLSWGLMAPSRYGEIARECAATVIVPRFRQRGFELEG